VTDVISPIEVGRKFATHGPVRVEAEDMVRWAAATDDYTTFHFDPSAAQARGFDSPVVTGPWKSAVLKTLLQGWLGAEATILRFETRYLVPDMLGNELTFGGEIDGIQYADDGSRLVECDLWIERSDGTVSVKARAVASMFIDEGQGLPMERLRKAVRLGEILGTFEYRVDESDVNRFAAGIEGSVVTAHSPGTAATVFWAALDPIERRDIDPDKFLHHLRFPIVGGGNAFNEVEYERPIRAGDVITVTTRYTEVYEKQGRKGTLLFRIRENELRDAAGALVARTRCGHVLTYDLTAVVTQGA
jgi:acyl dehydratase